MYIIKYFVAPVGLNEIYFTNIMIHKNMFFTKKTEEQTNIYTFFTIYRFSGCNEFSIFVTEVSSEVHECRQTFSL